MAIKKMNNVEKAIRLVIRMAMMMERRGIRNKWRVTIHFFLITKAYFVEIQRDFGIFLNVILFYIYFSALSRLICEII